MARRPQHSTFPVDPPEDYDESSYSSKQSEGYAYSMASRSRIPAYDEESDSRSEVSYDDRSEAYTVTDDGSYTHSEDSSFDWDDADAIYEPNIVDAMNKYQGHQDLQQIMYNSMRVRPVQERARLPMPEAEAGHDEPIAGLESDPDGEDNDEGIHPHPVEIPLAETVAAFVDAVEQKPDVAPIEAVDLRDARMPLSQKRKELDKLREQVGTEISIQPRQKVSQWKTAFLRNAKNFIQLIRPFQSTLKWIDSQYGADVFSYFVFVLWIINTNAITLGITFFFGMVPSIFWHDRNGNKSAVVISDVDKTFRPADIITGGNYLYDSFLHYGFYLSEYAVIFGGWNFDRTLGYLFALGFFYVFQFVVIIYSLTHSYGKLMSASLMGAKTKYCDTVFFLWEHSTRSREAIILNKTNIQTTLREMLVTVRRRENFRNILYFKRFLINCGIIVLISGISTGVWYLLNAETLARDDTDDDDINLARELAPAIIITAVNMFLPLLFSFVTKLEKYGNYEMELAMSLAKGVLLNFGTLGVLFFYWLIVKTGQRLDVTSLGTKDCRKDQTVECWETDLSMKFYQLVVMNLIFEWLITLLAIAAVAIQRLTGKKKWAVVFRADLLTQRIIYLQILTFLGTYYSPTMCGLTLISTALTVIREALIVRYTKFYKSAPLGSGTEATHVVYCAALLSSFVLAVVSIIFAITMFLPSNQCGPFKSLCPQPDVIVAAVARFAPIAKWLYTIADFIIMPAMLIFIMLQLLVFVYYYHVKSRAFDELTPVLQNHLALEGKDIAALYLQQQQEQQRRRRRRRRHRHRRENRSAGAERSTAHRVHRVQRETIISVLPTSSPDTIVTSRV